MPKMKNNSLVRQGLWIFMLVSFACPFIAQAQNPTFTVGTASGLPGSNIDLSVSFTSGATGAYSSEFSLSLPSGFTFVSKRAGSALAAAGYTLNSGGGLKSVIQDGSGGTTPLATGTIVIYTLAISSGTTPGSYPNFSLTGLVVSNSAGTAAVTCNAVSGIVTVTVPADTQAPSVPTGLTATAASSTQINLTWNASTDNVGVTGYRIYRGGVQIATSATNAYSNTGLTASTAYSYTVAAYDVAGNVSAQSAAASATTQAAADTQAPSVPTGLTATAASSTQINLTWNASTDNVGVTGYRIYRGGVQIATSATNAYSNTGLTASTAYSYTVAAYDAAGNVSAQSAAASATTQAAADTQAPSVPTGLTATAASSTQINLTWNASTDNVGVTGYRIYRGGVQIATSATNAYSNTGLTASTAYSYTVAAYDAASNVSAQSTTASATTQAAADTQAPSVPTGLTATAASSTQINLTWNASTDNVGVTGYRIYRGGVQIATSATNAYSNTGLTASTAYSYTVAAYDAAGNVSAQSAAASATTQAAADTQAPSVPTGLTATAASSTQINLTWNASTDNVGVTGYRIYRGGVQIATSATNAYSNTGLTASTAYSYTVAAYDVAGNVSAQSAAASATTQAAADTQAPSVPTGLTATAASSTQINLTWNASTDNVGVTGYRIYRGGVQIATSATNAYSNTGLTASTAYSYTVAAYDAAGNVSAQSAAASATTQAAADTQAPSVPTGLTATAASSTQINLTWNASTDNVGVTGYRIYRGGVQIATSATNAYSNTGLTASTAYSYTVAAYDAASNVSAQSTTASATTQAAADTQAPSVPTGLTATAASSTQINLTWNASTDNVGVTGYRIYRGGVQIATSATNAYSNTGLTASTAYSYTVAAYDAAGNVSAQSAAASATTQAAADTQAPSVPTGLTATAASSTQINLTWNASTDNVGVTGYRIYRGGVQIATSATNAYSNTGLTASTAYSYTVAAYDVAGNVSAQSAAASATTQAAADTQAPSVPTGLTATAASSTQINLTWNASTDNVGVTGYRIYRGGVQIATSATNAYSNTGLTASTAYSYTVAAYDAESNVSAQSTAASATTNSTADSQAPVLSSIGSANVTANAATINWITDEASDSQVEFGTTTSYGGSTALNSSMTTSHSVSLIGLTGGTTYHFRVKSKDATGNMATSADGTFITLLPAPGNVQVK